MKTYDYKSAIATAVGGTILAMSPGASAELLDPILPLPHTVITFDFVGEFVMFDPLDEIVPNTSSPAVTGTIQLDAITFGGSAAMGGEFFGAPWTANGALSAYVALPGINCGGAPMCAHANMDFAWSGNLIPVEAAFGMTPQFSGSIDLLDLSVGAEFAVESIDTEPDGVLGTRMTEGVFTGFTPYFVGTATVAGIDILGSPIPNQNIYVGPVPVPEASEWAMMLAGVGLVGAMAYRRKNRQVATAA